MTHITPPRRFDSKPSLSNFKINFLARAMSTILLMVSAGCGVGANMVEVEAPSPEVKSDQQEIVGGSVASNYHEAVMIDAYQPGSKYFCSGTLISPHVVLTAGHCVYGMQFWIVTAPYSLPQRFQESVATSGVTFDFNDGGEGVPKNEHDIGLVFLKNAISIPIYPEITSRPLPLGTSALDIGRVNNGVVSFSNLYGRGIKLGAASNTGYRFDYNSPHVSQPGDSGGPVMLFGPPPHVVIGVNSGEMVSLQVMARTDLLFSWIEMQIEIHEKRNPRVR